MTIIGIEGLILMVNVPQTVIGSMTVTSVVAIIASAVEPDRVRLPRLEPAAS